MNYWLKASNWSKMFGKDRSHDGTEKANAKRLNHVDHIWMISWSIQNWEWAFVPKYTYWIQWPIFNLNEKKANSITSIMIAMHQFFFRKKILLKILFFIFNIIIRHILRCISIRIVSKIKTNYYYSVEQKTNHTENPKKS